MQNQYHFESEGGGGVDDAIRRSEVNAWLQMIEANTASSSRSLMGFSTAIDGLRGDVSGIKSDTSRMVVFGSEISQALQNNHTDLKAFLESKLSGGGSGGGSDGGGDSSGIISAVNSGVSTLGGKLDAGNTQRGQILTDVNGIVQNTGQVNDYLSQIKSLIATSNQKQDEIKQKQEEQKQKQEEQKQKQDEIKQKQEEQKQKQDETKQKLDEIKDKIDEVKDEIGEKLEVEDIGSTSLDDSLSSVQESVRDGLGEKIDDQNEFSESLDDGSQYGLFSISLSSDPVWIEEDTYNVCGMEFDIGLNWNDSKWSWATQYRSFILLIQKLSLWLFTVFSAFRRLSSV